MTDDAPALRIRKPDPVQFRPEDPLKEHYVWWDAVDAEVVESYAELLESNPAERPMQAFLSEHPILLVQHLGGGHGRWVISEKSLGSEYRLDFAIAERDSFGFHWTAVELQSPRAKFFVPSSGRTTEDFDEAIRQIGEWRAWLKANLDYARRSRNDHGLGLTEIEPFTEGLIILGRQSEVTPAVAERVRSRVEGMNIRVHTFDWLTREAHRRMNELGTEKLAHMIDFAQQVESNVAKAPRSTDPTTFTQAEG